MYRPLMLTAGLVVLVVSGLVHGLWTQRWHTSAALDDAVARMQTVPLEVGLWQGANIEVDPEPFQQTRAVGYWMRRYTRAGTGGAVTVILMCGRATHMAIHTPDVCYHGAGFEMANEPQRETITFGKGSSGEFLTAKFRQPASAAGGQLHIYWAWTNDGRWQAPSAPRWTFGGAPFLYKLYVVYEAPPGAAATPVPAEFLQELLPQLQSSLFAPRAFSP